jgi:hypothetical protein
MKEKSGKKDWTNHPGHSILPVEPCVTVRGILIASAWDEQGRITAVSLSTKGEDEYLLDLEDDPTLFDMVRTEVEVQGIIEKGGKSKKILVRKYRLIRNTGTPLGLT